MPFTMSSGTFLSMLSVLQIKTIYLTSLFAYNKLRFISSDAKVNSVFPKVMVS